MQGVNACRFVGKLVRHSSSRVGENKVLLGKGELLLPDELFPNRGQIIHLRSWEETAELLDAVDKGTWVAVLCAYQPSTYQGKLQDTFFVTAFQEYGPQ